jgi:hypothetical protein
MPSLNPLWNTSSKYGQRVPRTTRCAAKGIFDSPRYMVTSEYLPLLNKLKCGQHYYANPEVSKSHLSNAVPEPESSPCGNDSRHTVKSCVRTNLVVTAVFDYSPTLCRLLRPSMLLAVSWVIAVVDVVPTAPAFDVARGLWVQLSTSNFRPVGCWKVGA